MIIIDFHTRQKQEVKLTSTLNLSEVLTNALEEYLLWRQGEIDESELSAIHILDSHIKTLEK